MLWLFIFSWIPWPSGFIDSVLNPYEYCLNQIKTDMIATEAHGKTRKNNDHKILFSV